MYTAGQPPESTDDLKRFIRDELENISREMLHVDGEWYDMIEPMTAGGIRGASGDFDMTEYNSTGIYQPSFDVGEKGFINFHINHDIKRGSLVYPHLHISSPGTSQEDVVFELTYTVAKRDDVTPEAFPATVTITFTFKVPTTSHSHYVTEVSDVDALDAPEVDSILLTSIERVSNGGTDHPNRVFVHFVDLHYQRERLGTPNKAPDYYKGYDKGFGWI